MSEIEIEPVPGLPQALPAGEQVLWQGRPSWRGLARRTFHLPWLAAYFAVLCAARALVTAQQGRGLGGALWAGLSLVPLAALCLGLLALLSWLNARAAIYTITNRRVVLRVGVAFPIAFNLPFKRMAAADLRLRDGDQGDITMEMSGPGRLAWLHLWPHARPWRFAPAQPAMRSIPGATRVAALLSDAVSAWAEAEGAALSPGGAASPTAPTAATAPTAIELGAALSAAPGHQAPA